MAGGKFLLVERQADIGRERLLADEPVEKAEACQERSCRRGVLCIVQVTPIWFAATAPR